MEKLSSLLRAVQLHGSIRTYSAPASMQGTNAHIVLGQAGVAYNDCHISLVPSLPWQHHRFWTGPAPSLLLQQHIPPTTGNACIMQASLGTAATACLLRSIHANGACALPLTPLLEVAAASYASLLSSKPDESLQVATVLEATAASRLSLAGHQHALLNCTVDWQTASCLVQPEYSLYKPQLQLLRCTFARAVHNQAASNLPGLLKPYCSLVPLGCSWDAYPYSAATAGLADLQVTRAGWHLAPSLTEAAEALHQASSCTAPVVATACSAITLQSAWQHVNNISRTGQAQLAVHNGGSACTDLRVLSRHGAGTLPVQLHGLSMSPVRLSNPRQYAPRTRRMPFGEATPG